MAKNNKKDKVQYNAKVFFIKDNSNIDALNEFLCRADISIYGLRYFAVSNKDLIIEVTYLNTSINDNIIDPEIMNDSITYDENNELTSIKSVRPRNKRFYTCDYILNGENYSVTGTAYNKKQFLDRIYSKQQRLKKKLNDDDIGLLITSCVEITFLEYINIIKNS